MVLMFKVRLTFRTFFRTEALMRFSLAVILAFFILISAPSPSSADAILTVKISKIVDGDSLKAGKLRLRLYGIDAPERKQICKDSAHKAYRCGLHATDYLAQILKSERQLECELKDVDRYRRLVVRCFQDGKDISAQLVKAGWALAYRQYATDYIQDEMRAQKDGLGVWQGAFIPPAEWRKSKK